MKILEITTITEVTECIKALTDLLKANTESRNGLFSSETEEEIVAKILSMMRRI